MRTVNKNIITVVVSGNFIDINNRRINYRVQIAMPNCMDEWLLSNVINRYLFETLRNCKEYTEDGKFITNNDYGSVSMIGTAKIEYTDKSGKSLLIDTGKTPSFYGKSIFDLSYMEIQDVATAFGLHEIQVTEDLQELQKDTVIAYLRRIKKLSEDEIREMSFYKYDKRRMKYYIDFSEEDKKKAVLNTYECADFEEFLEDDIALNGFRDVSELFDAPDTSVSNKKRKTAVEDANIKNDIDSLISSNITKF